LAWRRGGGGFGCDVLAARPADKQISYLLTQLIFLLQPLVIVVVVIVVVAVFVLVFVLVIGDGIEIFTFIE